MIEAVETGGELEVPLPEGFMKTQQFSCVREIVPQNQPMTILAKISFGLMGGLAVGAVFWFLCCGKKEESHGDEEEHHH